MKELIERLRLPGANRIATEAADALEKLSAEVEQLRKAQGEPVAEVKRDGILVQTGGVGLTVGQLLYTHPTTGEPTWLVGTNGVPYVNPANPTIERHVIPDGWKLVPIEPTLEQMDDMREAGHQYVVKRGKYDNGMLNGIYKAMLSAAPAPTKGA
jgi:hypothetical protein